MNKIYLLIIFSLHAFEGVGQQYLLYNGFDKCMDKITYDDATESIWIGSSSFNSGVSLVMFDKDKERFDLADLTSGITLQNVSSLSNANGVLYVGHYEGAAIIDIQNNEFNNHVDLDYSYQLSNVFFNPIDEKIYACNPTINLEAYNGTTWDKNPTLKAVLNHAYDEENNTMWMAAFFNKIYKMTASGIETIDVISSDIPGTNYIDIKLGKSGEMFLLSHQDGFAHFDGNAWNHYTSTNSDVFGGDLNDIAIDEHGVAWFAHNGGISSFDGNNFKFINLMNLFDVNHIEIDALTFDDNNHIWLVSCHGLHELWDINTTNIEIEDDLAKLYPNPTSGIVNIEIDQPLQLLKVYNTTGVNVGTYYNSSFDLSDMASGQYLIKLFYANGKSAYQNILKQ